MIQLEVIGGTETYMAVCRKCYFQPNSPQKRFTSVKSPNKSKMLSLNETVEPLNEASRVRPKNLFLENMLS